MIGHLRNLFLVTALSLSDASSDTFGLYAGRRLTPDTESHVQHHVDTSLYERDVDVQSTYNEDFMSLMQSPCRPEFDGYFGATYGSPIEITYGFKLETQPLASVMDVLDVIEDRIVDLVLSEVFPTSCGFRNRELKTETLYGHGHASGFRFMKFNEVAKCTLEESRVLFCGIFTGKISVYGREQEDSALEVLSVIDQVLNTQNTENLHPELVKISAQPEYLKIKYGDEKDGIPTIALAGAGIVGLFGLSCIWWFCCRSQKQGDSANANGKPKWNKEKEYPEENSIMPSFESETVSFDGGYTDHPASDPPAHGEII